MANNIAKNVDVIRRIAHLISPKIRLNLYYTMVRSYLNYENSMGI